MLTELPFGKREKGGRRSKADTKSNLSRPILFLWIGSIEYNYKFGFARPLKVAFIAYVYENYPPNDGRRVCSSNYKDQKNYVLGAYKVVTDLHDKSYSSRRF